MDGPAPDARRQRQVSGAATGHRDRPRVCVSVEQNEVDYGGFFGDCEGKTADRHQDDQRDYRYSSEHGPTSFKLCGRSPRHKPSSRCIQFIGGTCWSSIVAKGEHAAFGGMGPRFSFSPWQRPAPAIRTFTPINRRRGPAVGISGGDLAVGQGLLESTHALPDRDCGLRMRTEYSNWAMPFGASSDLA